METETALYGEMDAHVWAKKFCEMYPQAVDEGTMLGWFANAIMTGYDKGVFNTLESEDESDGQ